MHHSARIIPVQLLITLSTVASAQNLVPNPSFESITSCPTFASMLDHAAPWTNPTLGTPELFHACAPSGDYAGVPANSSGGYQWPRTGDGFAGIFVYRTAIPEMREYIMAPLLEPLEAGVCYTFRMFVNAANDHELVCDGVGARFTVGPISATSGTVLPMEPHIDHPMGVLINDTLNWTEVSGSYVASGGEDHVVIGNFRTDAQTAAAMFNPGVWYTQTAYLLVDDVSLVRSELPDLDLGADTLLCDGASLLLDATVPGATSTMWSDGITDVIRTVSTIGTYEVTVSIGACSVSDTITIDASPLPMIDLGPDLALCRGLEGTLSARVQHADEFLWDDGSTRLERTLREPGIHRATAFNVCGSTTDSVLVELEDCPESIYVPNAFTPNGDSFNDGFAPVFDARIWQVDFRIHDRWGRLIHQSPEGGAWSAMDTPAGVYVVDLHARSRTRPVQEQRSRGHVVVVR